jgi:hypothetical protein
MLCKTGVEPANPVYSTGLTGVRLLQAVNLSDNALTDKSLPGLANALRQMPELLSLDVSRNIVRGGGGGDDDDGGGGGGDDDDDDDGEEEE